MKARDIYKSLSSERYWSQKSERVRWWASRYYAGIETLEQLYAAAKPRPVTGSFVMNPELTEEEVREIISLR